MDWKRFSGSFSRQCNTRRSRAGDTWAPRTANSSPNSCRARKLYDIDNWIASGYYISGPALIRFLERLRSDGHGRVAKASQQVDYYRIAEEIEQVLLNDRQHMSSFVKI